MEPGKLDIRAVDLSPAELKAIEVHKYFLSQKLKREVSIEEAIRDFVENYHQEWQRWKLQQDNLAQVQQVERHQFLESAKAGKVVGFNAAAAEWRDKYAEIWRAERESLDQNDFLSLTATITNPRGLHMRPCSTVANIAGKFDCDVYVHRPKMEVFNFTLNGKPYLNVKSVLGLLTIAAIQGDVLEFIAHGREAQAALDAISRYIRDGLLPGAAA